MRERSINLGHQVEGAIFTRHNHIVSVDGDGILSFQNNITKVKPNEAIFIPSKVMVRFSFNSNENKSIKVSLYHINGINLNCKQDKVTSLINAYIEVEKLNLTNRETIIELIGSRLEKIKNNRVLYNYDPLEKKIYRLVSKDLKKKWSLEEVCKLTYTSKSTLNRKLKDNQTSMGQIISNARLDYATILITNTSLSVDEISMLSGFNSTSYFCKKFKESHGFSPKQYRKLLAYNQVPLNRI
ncbi:TPA: helix-turn-helix transcriptional regulator [Vibrio parahaemolyticus]|uniref:helix-turn-helix transcriptional regulator n=1 Tax=Vibrio parahaemolyticus TaxID=670 RepID=UPI001DD68691|nr:helix-turn-helix transcriptional regulator [Vibrio parahaemolyticus]EGQ8424352.1 helix-turn-helix domain-containing protein [Vibrio parahaemolyticus]EGR3431656.1 AraC family transcriptional regulator [Vibrio parahaemolyticus]